MITALFYVAAFVLGFGSAALEHGDIFFGRFCVAAGGITLIIIASGTFK